MDKMLKKVLHWKFKAEKSSTNAEGSKGRFSRLLKPCGEGKPEDFGGSKLRLIGSVSVVSAPESFASAVSAPPDTAVPDTAQGDTISSTNSPTSSPVDCDLKRDI
jgi:hypothetical protein